MWEAPAVGHRGRTLVCVPAPACFSALAAEAEGPGAYTRGVLSGNRHGSSPWLRGEPQGQGRGRRFFSLSRGDVEGAPSTSAS